MAPEQDMHDEGYGTAPASPPPVPNLDKFEKRLDDMARAINGFQTEQKTRETRSQIANYEAQINSKVRSTQQAVDAAERDLAKAFEDGDGNAIARAQRTMTERVADRERAVNAQQQFKREKQDMEARQGGRSGSPGSQQGEQPQLDTTNLNDWKSRNSSWYGVDTEMTKAAHEINRRIREAGVIPVGTPEYFAAIDRQMAQKYPSKFNSAPETSGSRQGAGSGQQQSNAGRIPNSVLDSWERMGIDVNDDKVLKRMVNNRSRLADKGILPAEPAYGSVFTR